jgi:hypothetical protein
MGTVNAEIGFRLFSSLVGAGDPNPTPSGGLQSIAPVVDPNSVTPGMWGFLSFVVLILAAVVLYFSLRKQLKRVNVPGDDGSGTAQSKTTSGPPPR